MSILILGSNGQLGGELVSAFGERAIGATRSELDICDKEAVSRCLEVVRPSIVINSAAFTAVDAAESRTDEARLVNATAPGYLAASCRHIGARLIHFSTDYVFDGSKSSPYVESDPVCPINAYGQTKLEGEQAVLAADPRNFVFRLSWVYSTHGRNFALTMLWLAREGKPIRVVDDQIGSPTNAWHIADAVQRIAYSLVTSDDPGGLLHLSAGGQTSWAGFARYLLQAALNDGAPAVELITTADFPTPARRPAFSVLSNERVEKRFGVRLPEWQDQADRWAEGVMGEGVTGSRQ